MLALAWLAASRAQAGKGIGTSDLGMIGYTLAEIRRLLVSLVQACVPDPEGSGAGAGGADDGSTRPGNATTGAAATRSPEWPAGGLIGGSGGGRPCARRRLRRRDQRRT